MTTVKNIYDYINSIAPYDTQEEWDNSGHLVGDFRKEVKKAVLALDATKAVCAFSADIGADLVITHHPIIFGGIKSVKSDTAVYSLASSGIAHLCAHKLDAQPLEDGRRVHRRARLRLLGPVPKPAHVPRQELAAVVAQDLPRDAVPLDAAPQRKQRCLGAGVVRYIPARIDAAAGVDERR